MPDMIRKVEKGLEKSKEGFAYIHVFSPCPTGWGYKPEETIEIAKLALETGLWFLGECRNGEDFTIKKPKEFKPVKEYLSKQKRFRHLGEEDYKLIESYRDEDWAHLERLLAR